MRLPVCFLLGLSVLVACSGGSTSSPLPPASGTVAQAVHPDTDYPILNGAVYHYAVQQTYLQTYPGMSPSPQPTQTSAAVVTVSTQAGGVAEFSQVAQFPTSTITQKSYYTTPVSNGLTLLDETKYVYESVSNASSPQKSKTIATSTYSLPFTVLETPFKAGQTWTQQYAYKSSQTSTNYGKTKYVSTYTETWNPDGSYSSISASKGSNASQDYKDTTVLSSDGSAVEVVEQGAYPKQTTTIGVPLLKNGKYVIPVTIDGKTADMADWYPSGGLPPSPLDTGSATDEGSVALPSACNVASSIATSAEKIVTTGTDFDTTGSTIAFNDVQYYAPAIGLVCEMDSQTQAIYNVGPPKTKLYTTIVQTYQSGLTSDQLSRALHRVGFARALTTASLALSAQVQGYREALRRDVRERVVRLHLQAAQRARY